MKRAEHLLTTVLLVGTLCYPGHAPAETQTIRWDRVMGAEPSRLDEAQTGRVATLLRREYCYFGCSRSIARCLDAAEPSHTARRLAGYVVRQVLEGRSDEEIREGIGHRGLSAHPLDFAAIDLDGTQCFGPQNAEVTVVEYADFECPFCRVISPILHRLGDQMGSDVRVCFKQFPVRGHRRALPTAFAALAAARQGEFWAMHDALYASAPRLSEADILRCAESAGISDMDRWRRDRRDQVFRSEIEEDKLEGIRNGVRGTPTLFINQKRYLGRMSEVELRDRLEEELDLLRGDP